MNKKQAYKQLEHILKDVEIHSLCNMLRGTKLDYWNNIWPIINTKKYISQAEYIDYSIDIDELDILRLLTACIFIEDNYK